MATIEERHGTTKTSYRVIWRHKGQRKTASYSSREAAESWKQLIESVDGDPAAADRALLRARSKAPKLSEVAESHISKLLKANEKTKHDYRRMVANHYQEIDWPVDMITADDLEQWVLGMMDADRSPKTIRNSHGLLYSVMGHAVKRGHRADNPCADTVLPEVEEQDESDKFMTAQEIAALFQYAPAHYLPHFTFLWGSGVRVGELLAITPEDFTMGGDGATWLRINKAVKPVPGSRRGQVGATKTKRSRRTIDIDDETMRHVWPLVRSAGHGNQVFRAGRTDELVSHNLRKVWYSMRDRAQRAEPPFQKSPNLHSLRHSHASHLLLNGWKMEDVSRRLGHASLGVTDKVYSHVAPGYERRAGSAMAGSVPLATIDRPAPVAQLVRAEDS